MKIKCEYCGSYISDTDEICPACGAINSHLVRSAEGIPKTIEELKEFCRSHNLPLDQMRFFIGEDFKQPKAFGIYQDSDGDFIVYKNKADGQRAIRYQGKDEAYAVNEIYQKMKSEILQRKSAKANKQSSKPYNPTYDKRRKPKSNFSLSLIVFIGCMFLVMLFSLFLPDTPDNGYYKYGNDYYYYYHSNWYYYDDQYNDWYYTSDIDSELSDNYSNYEETGGYSDDYGISNFEDSDYYSNDDNDSWNDDSWDDDDWDWDSNDSWDYNDSDWDSDW